MIPTKAELKQKSVVQTQYEEKRALLREAFVAGLDMMADIFSSYSAPAEPKMEKGLQEFAKVCKLSREVPLQKMYDSAGRFSIAVSLGNSVNQATNGRQEELCGFAFVAGAQTLSIKFVGDLNKTPESAPFPKVRAVHRESALRCFDRLSSGSSDLEAILKSVRDICPNEISETY